MKVELVDIREYFGSVHANNGISLMGKSGTIQGLLGENGAGETTLMQILSGYLTPDAESVLVDGCEVRFSSPAEAIARGIGMLHQDLLDIPSLTVLENFCLGYGDGLFLGPRSSRRELSGEHAREPDSHLLRLGGHADRGRGGLCPHDRGPVARQR
ncbi:MAG: ATP-binding cassette domain-containing protein [Anaerolineae bacterium]